MGEGEEMRERDKRGGRDQREGEGAGEKGL